MQDQKSAVVLDNGSGLMKAGYAGDDAPASVFLSVVGRPKHRNVMVGTETRDMYVGEEAMARRGVLTLDYPLANGIVRNWAEMEAIWRNTYDSELRCDPEERALLLTEAPRNPRQNREKMCEVMFEKFGVPALYISIQAVLALYASGRTTGIVCDSGDGVTHTVPIFEGYSLPHAVGRMDVAGRELTNYLQKLLAEEGLTLTTSAEVETVKKIKETVCYLAEDFNTLNNSTKVDTASFELPDGAIINVGHARFKCPEALFEPSMLGREDPGIHRLIRNSIQASDLDIRREMWENVILSGGSTCFRNIDSRLLHDLRSIAPPNSKVKVIAPPERNYSVWIGGSILASLSSFQDMWIAREDYDEFGAGIVHKKCV